LRNRIKAFIDICVDRLSRGLGGVLLLLLTTGPLHFGIRGISALVIVLSAAWIVYSAIARREYVASIRRRLESRRLDLGAVRLAVGDAAAIPMLEGAARGDNGRRAAYALTLLHEAPGYNVRPILTSLAGSSLPEVQDRVFEIAVEERFDGLLAI